MSHLHKVQGYIFNVQSYCIHDGPGIRSTVFLKGCPLKCLWCHNPESQRAVPELMFYEDKCVACGTCAGACPQTAIEWTAGTKPCTERSVCDACGQCANVCPVGAREITGKTASVADVLEQVLSDKMFFDGSGGGMTVSGGEPLFQPDFTAALLECAQAEGIHTAIESCNFASGDIIDKVYRHVDLALCDIKHMDTDIHRRITGVPNEQILSNIIYIRNVLKKPVAIRVPVVPGYNGDLENIAATAEFIKTKLDTDVPLHLLPYHRLGEAKGKSLEKTDYQLNVTPPDDAYMKERLALAESFGLKVHLGG